MNLATMLMNTVTPLSDYKPEASEPKKKKGRVMPKGDNRNRHIESLRRYKEVMQGNGWMTTAMVTEGICEWNVSNGFRRINDAYSTLNKWSKVGIIEVREKNGVKRGCQALFEWRWK